MRILTGLAFVFGLAVQAAAQERDGNAPVGGVVPLRLLRHKSVQDELKFTPEQVKKLEVESKKMRDRIVKDIEEGKRDSKKMFQESEKVVAAVVTLEQGKRLKQITLQLQGAGAFANSVLANEMELTEEQRKKLKELHEQTTKQVQKLFDGGAETRQDVRKKMTEINNQEQESILKLLTGEQQTKWKAKIGVVFKGEIRRGSPRTERDRS
jgi:hypothetical protein